MKMASAGDKGPGDQEALKVKLIARPRSAHVVVFMSIRGAVLSEWREVYVCVMPVPYLG